MGATDRHVSPVDTQRIIGVLDAWIVDRPGRVILAFLVVSGLFAVGLGGGGTDSGTDQFTQDVPAEQALQDVNDNFERITFGDDTGTTQLIHEGTNVLSKPELLRMLRAQQRLADNPELQVSGTSSVARSVARTLDPEASTADQQLRAVERATPSQIRQAVREAAASNPGFSSQLSDDFNRESASASATRASVTHRAGPGEGSTAGPGGGSEYPPNKVDRIKALVTDDSSTIWVQGTPPNTTGITTSVVLPSALFLIMLFLIVAYRDLVDVLIGLSAILLTLIWTFGFIGLVGIPFAVLLIAVPPILIAIGIDFGIHSINRYREERVTGKGISESMIVTTDQVSVAFFIVVGTSAIGFLSNVVSAFPPTRDFGIVAAAGIVFTFLIFGIFVPALKVTVDRARENYPIPTFSQTPFGSDTSALGRGLAAGIGVAKRAPVAFLLVALVLTAGGAVYATGVDTGFSPDDFNPDAETPEYLQYLPESIRPPEEFDYVRLNDYLDENFQQDAQVLMYVETPMERASALESIHRAGENPPSTFRSTGRQADARSIVTLIESRAEADPEFRALVERYDRTDDEIPDRNLDRIYDALESADGVDTSQFLDGSRRSTQVIYTVDGDAADEEVTDDAYAVAEGFRGTAQPTGSGVIFDEAISLVFESVIQSLVLTLVGAALFLIVAYWIIEGAPSLGVVNIIPIVVTVVALVASMRAVGLKFNAINGTILAIAVGIGIDYSVHIVHRFADEYAERDLYSALRRTVVGTGGALTGSMLTTVFGIGVLVLALNPALGAFGALISLSVLYAYLASLFVLPSVLVVWARLAGDDDAQLPLVDAVGGSRGDSATATQRGD